MVKLRELLAAVPAIASIPEHSALDQDVTGICTNSHACNPGELFIGMPGTRVDGGEFWQSAIGAGAVAALVSPSAAARYPLQDYCIITVEDVVSACAQVAAAFYQHPAQKLTLIGVTGTNGKTTTTHLIEYFFEQAEKNIALFGTLYTRWKGFSQTAAHTTPFAAYLQAQLAQAVAVNNEYGVMEVSSHALAQSRIKECSFKVAAFTNLTQDHLDFHRDMEDYFAAKSLLFSPEYLQGRAVINIDDEYGKRLQRSLNPEQVWTFSITDSSADLFTSDLFYLPTGVSGQLHTPKGTASFTSPLVGQFNLANLLAAVGVGLHLGLDLAQITAKLPNFAGVPGRMERVQIAPEQDISVIVDYAHTPDSLENMLNAARPFIKGRAICVFGCGGDRDRTKRPLMGRISTKLADLTFVTSDNPRTEEPDAIIQDILDGLPSGTQFHVVSDRAAAIERAILEAEPGDGVLIAGKGHEDYQILGTEKIHFDDREQAREALAKRLR